MNKIAEFFNEVLAELKKVEWPNQDETIRMTVIVIIATTLVGIYVGGVDYLLTKLLESVLQ